jgi:hypothetical protein
MERRKLGMIWLGYKWTHSYVDDSFRISEKSRGTYIYWSSLIDQIMHTTFAKYLNHHQIREGDQIYSLIHIFIIDLMKIYG